MVLVSQACVLQLERRQKNLFVPLKVHVHLVNGDGCSMQLHLRCPSAEHWEEVRREEHRLSAMELNTAWTGTVSLQADQAMTPTFVACALVKKRNKFIIARTNFGIAIPNLVCFSNV